MLSSINKKLNNGLPCYAECGGLMYLTEGIEDLEGDYKEAVGFLKGKCHMTKKLQNFGYAEIEVEKENKILSKGLKINCHEFHKSYVDLKEDKIYELTKNLYDDSTKNGAVGI